MDAKLNLQHWHELAQRFGPDLRATTKCRTIKALEIDALARRLRALPGDAPRVLEVGCGNAVNGVALCHRFPAIRWTGCDAVPEMVANARALIADQPPEVAARMRVAVASALALDGFAGERFDAVYTDRCLINLASAEEQIRAARAIARLLPPRGLFLMLENSRQTHARLNDARIALGLPARPPADYNVFLDEEVVLPALRDVYELEGVDDFGSLHDLLLYAVEPAARPGGEVVYDDALMEALTALSIRLAEVHGYVFGAFGQNRLWRLRARA